MNIKPEHEDRPHATQVFAHPNPKHLAKGDKPLYLHFITEDTKKSDAYIIFTMNYEDVAGTKYIQRIVFMKDEYGVEINPSLPKIIE